MILSVTAQVGAGMRPHVLSGTLLDVTDARRLHHAAEADSIAGLQAELVRMRESARTRELISQATGVLMERHKLTADEAGALLRRASQVAGRKLPEVASQLLYTGKLAGDVSPSVRHTPRQRLPA
jgi:AmiR/NasT family two-component response regulator